MFVQKCGFEKPTVRLFVSVLIMMAFSGVVIAQDATPPPPDATKPAPAAQANATVRPDAYIIGAEDVLSVYVWKEPDMSKSVPVRPDGMISLPLIGEIKAAGYTPVQLRDVLVEAMKKRVS